METNIFDTLADANHLVVKLGGENVGRFDENARLLDGLSRRNSNQTVGLVVSALRSAGFNTTSQLISAGNEARRGHLGQTGEILAGVRRFLTEAIEGESEQVQRAFTRLFDRAWAPFLEAAQLKHVGRERRFFQHGEDRLYTPNEGGIVSLTGRGESLAECVTALAFEERGQRLSRLYPEALTTTVFEGYPEVGPKDLRRRLEAGVGGFLDRNICLGSHWVSGGALPGMADGRGYSDVASVFLANQILGRQPDAKVIVGIAKQSPIMSVDPRKYPQQARPVSGLTLKAAIELFGPHGLNAAALHPDAAKSLGALDCWVFNPGNPSLGGTLISQNYRPNREGVLVVGSRDIPAQVHVESPDMVERTGVVAKVAELLGTAVVSHLFTSEDTLTLTLNGNSDVLSVDVLQEALRRAYDETYEVTLDVGNQTMVFGVGNAIHGPRVSAQAGLALDRAGVRPSHFHVDERAGVVKMIVPKGDAERVVGLLHEALIENPATLSA